MDMLNAVATLMVAALVIYVWVKRKKTGEDTLAFSQKKEWIFLGIVMIVAVAFRVWQFGDIPGGFNQDGAMAAVDANALANYGTDRFGMWLPVHFTAWGYGQMSVLMSYCMVPFIKLFGLSAITARLPILLFSLGGMAALYYLVKDVFNQRVAMIAFLFTAFCPWHFIQSRWALDCNMFPHVFIIGLFLLNRGLKVKKDRFIYGSMFCFAMCMYCYGISFYTVPVFLLGISAYMLCKKVLSWKQVGISAGVYLLFSWPIYLTMAINTFKWSTIETPLFTMAFFPNSMRSQDILFFVDDKAGQLTSNLKSFLDVVVMQKADLIWNEIPEYGNIFLCFMPVALLGIYGLYRAFKRDKDTVRRAGVMSVICFGIMGVLAGLITSAVNVNRVNIIFYFMIILVALGVYEIYLQRKKLVILVAMCYLIFGCLFVKTYFTDYAETMNVTFYGGLVDAIQEVGCDGDGEIYITPDASVPGGTVTAEILTMFADKIDAEYYQGKTNEQNGKEQMAYAAKFHYVSTDQLIPDTTKKATYIVPETERDKFDESTYSIKERSGYIIVKNK